MTRRRRRFGGKKLVGHTGPSGSFNMIALADKAVGRKQESALTKEQRNWEVLEADQNEQGKRLETMLETENENNLDLPELEIEENDGQEGKLDLTKVENEVNSEQLEDNELDVNESFQDYENAEKMQENLDLNEPSEQDDENAKQENKLDLNELEPEVNAEQLEESYISLSNSGLNDDCRG